MLHLGWLNYWSAAAARAIGFSDPARDAELLSPARRTASGGWGYSSGHTGAGAVDGRMRTQEVTHP